MKLATVIVFVDDLPRMRRFYADVLGLTVVEVTDGWVRLDAEGCSVALHALPPGAPAVPADPPARLDAYVKLAFHAHDVAAERARLLAAGVPMGDIVRFGTIELCDGRDPEGNVVQISSRPPPS